MAKQADAADLKSAALHGAYRFEPGSGHQRRYRSSAARCSGRHGPGASLGLAPVARTDAPATCQGALAVLDGAAVAYEARDGAGAVTGGGAADSGEGLHSRHDRGDQFGIRIARRSVGARIGSAPDARGDRVLRRDRSTLDETRRWGGGRGGRWWGGRRFARDGHARKADQPLAAGLDSRRTVRLVDHEALDTLGSRRGTARWRFDCRRCSLFCPRGGRLQCRLGAHQRHVRVAGVVAVRGKDQCCSPGEGDADEDDPSLGPPGSRRARGVLAWPQR